MKKNLLLTIVTLITIIISSCSTDFDMYADYEDITVVYGIVDIGDDTTWIKITKAYTGPGNALLIANNPDSSNYPYKLDVKLLGKKNGNDLEPIICDTITIHNKEITEIIIKENGDTVILNPFYSPNQLMYYANGNLDVDAEYTLSIIKKEETLTAVSGIVENFHIVKPNSRFSFSKVTDGVIEWGAAKNGIRNEVSLRFDYREFAAGYPDTLHKSVEWFVGTRNAKSDDGTESMAISYSGTRFFDILENELEPIPNVERWADSVDITIACGSQELTTYLNINAAGSSTLLEEVPVFSNIDGGTGLFASRHTIVKPVKLSFATERTLIEEHDLGFKLK
jgi:hypothetical protein